MVCERLSGGTEQPRAFPVQEVCVTLSGDDTGTRTLWSHASVHAVALLSAVALLLLLMMLNVFINIVGSSLLVSVV